jgi:DNA repair exonuclease SbcCD ATPase subunit|tara:strand:+ start:84 stop:1055 length:972 start_codon:yes stop_codon:yes gene_type:complete
MGLFSNLFGWITKLFRFGKSKDVSSDSSDVESDSEKKEMEEIGAKLENIEAKLEKKEENIEAEEGFEEAKIEEEEVELKKVEASISEEKVAETTGDERIIESAKQHEKEDVNKLKKHLADLTQQLARFEVDEKKEVGELEGKTKELRNLIDELYTAEKSGRFTSYEEMKEKEKQAGEARAGSSLDIIDASISGVSLEKLEGRIEEVRAEIAKVENSLENPRGLVPSELEWGLKDLERNLKTLFLEVSTKRKNHKSAMERIESSINRSLKTASAALKKQNIPSGSIELGEEKPAKEDVVHATPINNNEDIWEGIEWGKTPTPKK